MDSPEHLRLNEWAKLAPSQRIYWCRLMAEEARLEGMGAPAGLRQVYRELITHWSQLASEIEKTLPVQQPLRGNP